MLNLISALRPAIAGMRRASLFSLSAVLVIAATISACDSRDKTAEPTQVAVRVNSQDISIHQVEAVLEGQPNLVARFGDQAPKRVLNSLVEQELAAQAAKSAGLDHSPQVLQALELAKREVLARAYQDKLAGKAVEPGSNEVDRYYESKPELFAQRKRYTLQDTVVEVPADQFADLSNRVRQLSKLEDVEPLLRNAGLRYSTRAQTRFAEELPTTLLAKIVPLAPGQSVAVERDGGAEIFTMVHSDSVPLSLATARPTIKAFLLQERRRELVEQGMKTLRDAAKVEYVTMPTKASEPTRASSP